MIDQFIKDNYNKLYKIARNINRNKAGELISELYMYLVKKNYNKTDEELMKLSVHFMKFSNDMTNSNFNKTERLRSYEYGLGGDITDDSIESDIYLMSECNTTFTKDYLKDLTNDYTEEQIKNIIRVNLYLSKLDLHELILYDLWINKRMSRKSISKKIKLPSTTVYDMIQALKKKIKNNI